MSAILHITEQATFELSSSASHWCGCWLNTGVTVDMLSHGLMLT